MPIDLGDHFMDIVNQARYWSLSGITCLNYYVLDVLKSLCRL